jgi:hypothetical protein
LIKLELKTRLPETLPTKGCWPRRCCWFASDEAGAEVEAPPCRPCPAAAAAARAGWDGVAPSLLPRLSSWAMRSCVDFGAGAACMGAPLCPSCCCCCCWGG